MKKPLCLAYFEGEPRSWHSITCATWNYNLHIDFLVLTTAPFYKKWFDFLANYPRINLVQTETLIERASLSGLFSQECLECFENEDLKALASALKPFYPYLYFELYKERHISGWIDLDTCIAPNLDPSCDLSFFVTSCKYLQFRKRNGQCCFWTQPYFIKRYPSILRFKKRKKTCYRYDEYSFGRAVEKNGYLIKKQGGVFYSSNKKVERKRFSNLSWSNNGLLLEQKPIVFFSPKIDPVLNNYDSSILREGRPWTIKNRDSISFILEEN